MLPSAFWLACQKNNQRDAHFIEVGATVRLKNDVFHSYLVFSFRVLRHRLTPLAAATEPPPPLYTCWARVFFRAFLCPDVVFRHFFEQQKWNQDARRGQTSDAEKSSVRGSEKVSLIESSINRRF